MTLFRFYAIVFALVFFLSVVKGQDTLEIYENSGVHLQEDPTLDSVMQVWKNYLTSEDNGIGSSAYWNKEVQEQYGNYDFAAVKYGRNWYWRLGYQPSILSVRPKGDYYQIKTMFSRVVDSPQVDVLAILNVYAQKVNGEYKLFNALPIHTQHWEQKRVGSINYRYPPRHLFNDSLAREMNHFIDTLKNKFNLDTTYSIDFYFADEWRTIQHIKGFEYYSGMGTPTEKVRARQNGANQIIFTNAGQPWHAHEMVHIYLVPEFPKAGKFHEGVACLFGGHLYHPLEWHYDRMHDYLVEHPDINLDSLFQFTYMDEYTDPQHVLSGLFCQIAYEAGGIDKLEQLLRYGETRSDEHSYKENFYAALEDVLGISRGNLDEFIRAELKERSQEAE